MDSLPPLIRSTFVLMSGLTELASKPSFGGRIFLTGMKFFVRIWGTGRHWTLKRLQVFERNFTSDLGMFTLIWISVCILTYFIVVGTQVLLCKTWPSLPWLPKQKNEHARNWKDEQGRLIVRWSKISIPILLFFIYSSYPQSSPVFCAKLCGFRHIELHVWESQ